MYAKLKKTFRSLLPALACAVVALTGGDVLAQDPTPTATQAAITNAIDKVTGDTGLAQIAASNSVNMIIAVAGFAIAILLVGGGIRLVWRMFSGARC